MFVVLHALGLHLISGKLFVTLVIKHPIIKSFLNFTTRSSMLHEAVLTLAVLGLVGGKVPKDAPKCNEEIDKALKKLFPDPVPEDLLEETSRMGPWSVNIVTAPNLPQLKRQQEVCTCYFVSGDKKMTTSIKKMVPGALPRPFEITEKKDEYELKSKVDPEDQFTVLAVYFKNGVSVVSKCCNHCEGDAVHLAIAVADKKLNDADTQQSITEVMNKLKSIDVEVSMEELHKCTSHEAHNLLVH